jgi:hypothetical protein
MGHALTRWSWRSRSTICVAGRRRLGGSEHAEVNERYERRVEQRLAALDAND